MKTSQLQIRVSPREKDLLKRLASDAGLSVSRYVLQQVLPSAHLDLQRKVGELSRAEGRAEAITELLELLSTIGEEELAGLPETTIPPDLPPVVTNYAVAAIEWVAGRRGIEAPAWTEAVQPLEQPHFGRNLISLKPHLMRSTPVSFKRRNAFFEIEDSDPVPVDAPRQLEPSGAHEALRALNAELESRGVLVEIVQAGGALFSVAYRARPGTRRPGVQLYKGAGVTRALETVQVDMRLDDDWLLQTCREILQHGSSIDLPSLRVYQGRPDYLLALKCLEIASGTPAAAADDVRYLLRTLGVTKADDALVIADRFLRRRWLPADLPRLLEALLN